MVRRLRQTLMDYMVIGISPALIMGMVGSLLFFLLTVFYHGQYAGRLNFIFAMFTLAVVLIARISMERGIEYASIFAIALAVVTALAMARFVQIEGPLAGFSNLINWGLIAIVWWSAHKLTWDCTFIDDQQDASGEGLLQAVGFDSETVEQQASAVQSGGAQSPDSAHDGQHSAAAQRGGPDWYQRMVEQRRRPHTPGVWVMYYALAALPLFGGRAIANTSFRHGEPAACVSAHLRVCRLCVGLAADHQFPRAAPVPAATQPADARGHGRPVAGIGCGDHCCRTVAVCPAASPRRIADRVATSVRIRFSRPSAHESPCAGQ